MSQSLGFISCDHPAMCGKAKKYIFDMNGGGGAVIPAAFLDCSLKFMFPLNFKDETDNETA
jgi:hypothetical protein